MTSGDASRAQRETSNASPWLMVAVGFLALALAYSARAALSLVMPTMDEELGWSRGFISANAAAALVVMGVLAPVAGRLVDTRGARGTLAAGLAALALGCFAVALAYNKVVFTIAFGVVAAIGFGLVAMHAVAAAVGGRFERRQGLAIGLAISGSGGGQFIVVPLIALLIVVVSWRWSFVALGLASLALIPLMLWSFPGREGAGRHHSPPHGAKLDADLRSDLRLVLRAPTFHLLFWSYALCGYTTTGVIETHFLPYAALCGFQPVTSATAFGVLSAVNLAGMVLAGWLTDKVNRPQLLAGIYLLRALSFVLLLNVGADVELLFLFSIIFGIVDYSTLPVTASLAASHIGARVMGLSLGLIMVGHSLGAGAGAYLGGYLYDIHLGYDWVWWSSFGLSILAAVLVSLMNDGPARSRGAAPA